MQQATSEDSYSFNIFWGLMASRNHLVPACFHSLLLFFLMLLTQLQAGWNPVHFLGLPVLPPLPTFAEASSMFLALLFLSWASNRPFIQS